MPAAAAFISPTPAFPNVFLARSHDGGFSWLRPDSPITEPGERGSAFDTIHQHDGIGVVVGAAWSAPAPVDTVRDYNPLTRIAVDDAPDGTLYAVLADQTRGKESLRFFRLDPGAGGWTRTKVEPLPDGWIVFGLPSLSVAGNGRIGLVAYYLRDIPGNYLHAVFFSTSHDRGQSWDPPVQLSPPGSDDVHWEPHIAADGRGRWHVTWLSDPPTYTRSLDGSGTAWTNPVSVIPDSLFTITIIPRTLSIAADEAGDAYITVHVGPYGRERLILMTTRAHPYDGLDALPFYTAVATPNPFRQATTITLFVPEPARASDL